MKVYISLIEEKDPAGPETAYPFIRYYHRKPAAISAIMDELCDAILDYAKNQTWIPRDAAISHDCYGEQAGERILYHVRLRYPHITVSARLIEAKTDGNGIVFSHLPKESGKYNPAVCNDWNIIYRDIHYRENFASALEMMLKGSDPPILPDSTL